MVTDYSETYRSDVSYTLEPVALEQAKSMFAQTVSRADTLTVREVQVIGCAEDRDNAYYRIYMNALYRVETGEEITRSAYMDVGVRMSDRSAFDATQVIADVFSRYSIYQEKVALTAIPQSDPDTPDYEDAAMQIAVRQLKTSASGKAVRAVRQDDLCDEPQLSVYDVLCVGVNDYGNTIPCVYTVYMAFEDGVVRQLDPAQIQF